MHIVADQVALLSTWRAGGQTEDGRKDPEARDAAGEAAAACTVKGESWGIALMEREQEVAQAVAVPWEEVVVVVEAVG